MWNSFIYKDEAYVVKVVQTSLNDSSKYQIILSDMTRVWIEELMLEQIIERWKTLNPLIDTTEKVCTSIVLSTLRNLTADSELTVVKTDGIVTLECTTNSEGAAVRISFDLELSDASTFCKEITVPMMQTIQLLEKQQRTLCDLLEKKDIEIQQHVFENGELKRQHVTTDKFDKTALSAASAELCCRIFSQSDEFQRIMVEKYGCPEPALLTVKKEENVSKKVKLSVAKRIIRHKRSKLTSS